MRQNTYSWLQQIFFTRDWLSVSAIFVLALLVRVVGLSVTPNGFHIDELMSGYIGRFVLLNGKDIYGNSWPLFYFNTFGDYRVILPMYLNGLSTFVFGVNIFAVRFPTALIGSLIVFPLFSITKKMFGRNLLALMPLIIIAFLPWHIVLSRSTSEGIVGLTVFVCGLAALFNSFTEKKWWYFGIAQLCFFLTYFLYPTFRVLVPLTLLPIVFLIRNHAGDRSFASLRMTKIVNWPKQKSFRYFVALAFFILFTFWVSTTVWGKGRYEQTSLLTSAQVASQVKEKEKALSFGEGEGHVVEAKLFDNKIVGYTQAFLTNYFSYFSPNFLLFDGGLPDRYVIPDVGLIFFALLIFLVGLFLPGDVGIEKKWYFYLWYLLSIAAVPGALTVDDTPNVHRVLFMMIPLIFLCTVGCLKLHAFFHQHTNVFLALLCLLIVVGAGEFIYFEHQYVVQEPSYRSQARDDGEIQYASLLAKYNREHVSVLTPVFEAAPIYYLFMTDDFAKQYAGAFTQGQSPIISQIGSIRFVPDACPADLPQKYHIDPGMIVIEDSGCIQNGHQTGAIYRHDSTEAFAILSKY